MHRLAETLSIAGLMLTLIGAALGTFAVWVSPDEAIRVRFRCS